MWFFSNFVAFSENLNYNCVTILMRLKNEFCPILQALAHAPTFMFVFMAGIIYSIMGYLLCFLPLNSFQSIWRSFLVNLSTVSPFSFLLIFHFRGKLKKLVWNVLLFLLIIAQLGLDLYLNLQDIQLSNTIMRIFIYFLSSLCLPKKISGLRLWRVLYLMF